MDTYEKKYNEALERAKAIINDYEERGLEEILFYAKEDLEGIFPELKESEDERIRKLLISGMKNLNYNTETFASIPIKDVIAWLEKQGDKDKLIKELGEYKVKYTQEVLSQQLEKQSKKKSQRMISAEAKEALYDKPAWSEEDDKMLYDAIGAIGAADYYTYDDKVEIERWLKSIKQKIGG